MKLREIRAALMARNFECQPIVKENGARYFKPTAKSTIMIIADEETPGSIHLTRIVEGSVVVGEFKKSEPTLIDALQHAILNQEDAHFDLDQEFPAFLQMEMLTTIPEHN